MDRQRFNVHVNNVDNAGSKGITINGNQFLECGSDHNEINVCTMV